MGEPTDDDDHGRFRCRVCGREFDSEEELHDHVLDKGLLR